MKTAVILLSLSGLVACATNPQGLNDRLVQNSEIRYLSRDACNELIFRIEVEDVVHVGPPRFETLYKVNGKYLNTTYCSSGCWVEIIPEEEVIKMKQAYDTIKQNKQNRIATELDGLL